MRWPRTITTFTRLERAAIRAVVVSLTIVVAALVVTVGLAIHRVQTDRPRAWFDSSLWINMTVYLLLASGAFLVFAGVRGGRLVARNGFTICPGCLHPLSGLPDDGECPRCARPYMGARVREHWRRQYPDFGLIRATPVATRRERAMRLALYVLWGYTSLGLAGVFLALTLLGFLPSDHALRSVPWTLVLLSAILTAIVAAVMDHRAKGIGERAVLAAGFQVCPACQYVLQGVPDGSCPECGRAFTHQDLRRLWRETYSIRL